MLLFVRANATLLYHRRVTIFDVFLARALLEIGGNLTALLVSFAVFYCIGEMEVPKDLPMFYLGYFYMIWWCVAAAMIVGALSERSEWVEKIWQPYSYLYLMFSGFFFRGLAAAGLRSALPALRKHTYIIRGGSRYAVRTYGDPLYTAFALAF
jgi:ABC-type polysaccharide/polyol phosphate export permease